MLDQTTSTFFNKKDPWIKDIKAAYKPEEIAELIKKRMGFPRTYGPYPGTNEDPSDIIDTLILADENNRKKIVPAIGLLLYNLLFDKEKESHELLRGVFSIIANSRIKECGSLVRKWLIAKKDAMGCDDIKWKTTYRYAMTALAYVQDGGDNAIKDWWYNVWKDGTPFWWSSAFVGMRVQSSQLAARELRVLIERNYDKAGWLLAGMWSDDRSRKEFVREVSDGLKNGNGWAGIAVNNTIEKLKEDKRKELLLDLRKVMYLA